MFVTKGQEVPGELLDLARVRGIPLLRSRLKTAEFYRRIKPIVEEAFAPRTTLHGSLADVYGVGLLFIGQSGIGKSECVLDLVERGDRLVADDIVQVGPGGAGTSSIGSGHELLGGRSHGNPGWDWSTSPPCSASGRCGSRSALKWWSSWRAGRRQGCRPYRAAAVGDHHTSEVTLPRVIVPLNPGKNITVISEVVAMMHLLRFAGVDVAAAFNQRLIKKMREKQGLREYLQEDYE